jgi:hypothetical protein
LGGYFLRALAFATLYGGMASGFTCTTRRIKSPNLILGVAMVAVFWFMLGWLTKPYLNAKKRQATAH